MPPSRARIWTGLSALCGVIGLSMPAWAGYIGQTADATYEQPKGSVIIEGGPMTVGAGVEWTGIFPIVSVDLSDTQIIVSGSGGGFNGGFVGIHISSDPALTGDITGVSASSNLSGFSPANVTFDDGDVWINLASMNFSPGSKFVSVDVTFADVVPEPGTLPLTALGLFALWAARHRSTRCPA